MRPHVLANATALDLAPAFTPLTLGQNYSYTASQIFGAPALLRIAGRNALHRIANDTFRPNA